MDAKVAVLTPIAVDHAKYLGETPAIIALEKVGIIKPGATVVSPTRRPRSTRWSASAAPRSERPWPVRDWSSG